MKECLDTSVVVKWFKESEPLEKEALSIKQKLETMETEIIINEWLQFELVRALVKSGYSKEKIQNVIEYMDGIIDIGAIRVIQVNEVKYLTQKFEIDYALYASDAVHLATAIHTSSNIFWVADKHFQKQEILSLAKNTGLLIKHLSEIG